MPCLCRVCTVSVPRLLARQAVIAWADCRVSRRDDAQWGGATPSSFCRGSVQWVMASDGLLEGQMTTRLLHLMLPPVANNGFLLLESGKGKVVSRYIKLLQPQLLPLCGDFYGFRQFFHFHVDRFSVTLFTLTCVIHYKNQGNIKTAGSSQTPIHPLNLLLFTETKLLFLLLIHTIYVLFKH